MPTYGTPQPKPYQRQVQRTYLPLANAGGYAPIVETPAVPLAYPSQFVDSRSRRTMRGNVDPLFFRR